VAAAVVLLVLGVVMAARGANPSDGESSSAFGHVHGLGVDPADGALYAATHYGLFRVSEDGGSSRVADRVQDFMGFTVLRPNHFLASGHPGKGQDGPTSLGLIESTDAGQTWRPLSLTGEADFHALEARHGLVYGFNAMTGRFMVSQDTKTWDVRSTLPMADFTVSPKQVDLVVATTEQGLARSDDGGRTFRVVKGTPLLLLANWADDGTLVGAGPDGTIYASTDDGASWQRRGSLEAAPEALQAITKDLIYAATGEAVLTSTDGGWSFNTHNR
jgi:photosystem II stability/assembly factor-like uncharacterized protein